MGLRDDCASIYRNSRNYPTDALQRYATFDEWAIVIFHYDGSKKFMDLQQCCDVQNQEPPPSDYKLAMPNFSATTIASAVFWQWSFRRMF